MFFIKEIQGMRTLAVLAVVLAHLETSWLPGGFVGVDVFFVISGYLITGLLLREYQSTGTIKLSAFYQRRIRRLFPALLATCMLTVLGGFLLHSDHHFKLLLDSTLAAFFSVSNFHFWSQVGYFDAASSTKPLLHTWSLGVEEQFYLVWPLLIMACLRNLSKASLITVLIASSLVSFALNWLFISHNWGDQLGEINSWRSGFLDGGSTAFYLMPFRIFEFGIGSLLIFLLPNNHRIKPLIADVILASALVGLIILMAHLTEKSIFPFYNALFVALLSAAVIAVSNHSKAGRILLANRTMVFVGGISYSLYLVHWPIIVYYKALFGELGSADFPILLLVIFFAGYALNIFVENRLRKSSHADTATAPTAIFARSIPFVLLTISVCIVLLLGHTKGRVPKQRVALSIIGQLNSEKKKYCSRSISGFPEDIFTCQNDRHSDKTIIIWGDSHAAHLVGGFSELFPHTNIATASLPGCISQSGFNGLIRNYPSKKLTDQCVNRNKSLLDWAQHYKGNATFVISNAKRNRPEQIAPINNEHIRLIESFGHSAYVLSDFIRPEVALAQCYAVPNFIFTDEMLLKRCKVDQRMIEFELRYNAGLAAISKNFLPAYNFQCPENACEFVDDRGRVTYRDTHHLATTGSIYEIRRAAPLILKYIDPEHINKESRE